MGMRSLTSFTALLAALLLWQAALAHENRGGPRAVTLWWLFFNNPDACMTNPGSTEQCGEIDVFGEPYLDSVKTGAPDPSLISPNLNAKLGVVFATGGITNAKGRIKLVAAAYRSAADVPLNLGPNVVDPLALGRAFENVDAEIHLVVRDHGRRVRGQSTTQITNFLEPFCSDPGLLFFSGPNICQDVQFAVFASGESGEDSIFTFRDTRAPVRRAKAILIRNGDMVQAVVDTRITRPRKKHH